MPIYKNAVKNMKVNNGTNSTIGKDLKIVHEAEETKSNLKLEYQNFAQHTT